MIGGVSDHLLYDGDCAFCSTSARWAGRWIKARATLVPWQRVKIVESGLTAAECADAVQWVGPHGAPEAKAAGPLAIGWFLGTAGQPWRSVGWLLRRRPVLAVAWPVYHWVSRNRHRLPGGTPACSLSDRPV
jgi:predicted DCC family thiol-disulfide oxidoreductase YuxK